MHQTRKQFDELTINDEKKDLQHAKIVSQASIVAPSSPSGLPKLLGRGPSGGTRYGRRIQPIQSSGALALQKAMQALFPVFGFIGAASLCMRFGYFTVRLPFSAHGLSGRYQVPP